MLRKWLQPISKDRRQEVLDQLSQESSPGFDFFLMVLLSCGIATFGLITNSTAVIIGAMLVAPLMSPILGLSLASVVARGRIFRRAALALLEGTVMSMVLSAFLGWISKILPFDFLIVLPSEVLSRTHPSPFDLGIALAGGAAAAYALANPRLSATLPGVAIATAIMPPLCTIGIGLATSNWSVALGATLLFVTNLAAISFAGILVFVALGFRPLEREARWHRIPRSLLISAVLVMLVTVPLVLLTLRLVSQADYTKMVQDTVAAQIATLPDAQLMEVQINQSDTILHLQVTVLTTRQPSYEQVVALQKEIALQLNRQTSLQLIVVPGTRLDPLLPPTLTPTPTPTPSIVPSMTATVTSTSTLTPTPTNTFTPTPVLAFIANTGGKGVYVFDTPAGKVIGSLSDGSSIHILYQREIINGQEWLEILRDNGQIGWVPAIYVIIRP